MEEGQVPGALQAGVGSKPFIPTSVQHLVVDGEWDQYTILQLQLQLIVGCSL